MDAPWGFFDGAAQGVPSKGGVGGMLHLCSTHSIAFSTSLGTTSNNFSELMALHLILQLAQDHHTITHLWGFSTGYQLDEWGLHYLQDIKA